MVPLDMYQDVVEWIRPRLQGQHNGWGGEVEMLLADMYDDTEDFRVLAEAKSDMNALYIRGLAIPVRQRTQEMQQDLEMMSLEIRNLGIAMFVYYVHRITEDFNKLQPEEQFEYMMICHPDDISGI